jgi:hypothetical protein
VLFDVGSKRVSEANGTCQNLLGYTPEAILELTLYDLVPYSRKLSTNSPYLWEMLGGDRRDSNPRPSEPQSADLDFWALPFIAKSAYLTRFLCWWLPTVPGCCALSGVRRGVKWHQPLPLSR